MSYNPFSLNGKRILVTGAASGIGKATALECAKMGANLYLVDKDEKNLNSTLKEISGENQKAILADLTSENDLLTITNKISKLDGLFSNAGIVLSLVAQMSDEKDTEKIFKINTFSHIRLIQLLLQHKKLNKEASIVFTSSMSGVFCGAVGGSLYGATKAALNGYAKALSLELAPRGIRVNTVNPGMIKTGIFNLSSISQDQMEEDAKRYPLKRYGNPEEVAYAVIYLLSDATKWMTGSSILLDGGYSNQ